MKKNIITIKKETKINDDIVLEKGDRIQILKEGTIGTNFKFNMPVGVFDDVEVENYIEVMALKIAKDQISVFQNEIEELLYGLINDDVSIHESGIFMRADYDRARGILEFQISD